MNPTDATTSDQRSGTDRQEGGRRRIKAGRLLRRVLPRSLFGRSLLMIVLPVLLLLAISTFLFYNRHWDNVTRHMTLSAAGDIALTIDILAEFPEGEERERLLHLIRADTGIDVEFQSGAILPNTEPPIGDTILERMMAQSLTQAIYRPFHLDATGNREFVSVRIQLQDGILSAHIPRKRVSSATTYIFILWMVSVSLVLTLVALIFLRNQMRSIRRLALAADSFGKGRDVTHFKPEGASEVRRAAHAFLRMRDRIRRQISQRTDMLAGVSHDLRTPLTRMKLQLALMPRTDDITELQADVDEMERMVEGYLAFARGEGAEESAENEDLATLAREVIERAQWHDAVVRYHGPDQALAIVRPQALKRCLTNIVENACRFAAHVEVTVATSGDAIDITIDDDGPGIPAKLREEAFRPFRRLTPGSHTPDADTGADGPAQFHAGEGIGLGLSIARDIMRGHGGEILLDDSPSGGLRVTLHLPL